jgi:hypothetical protein
MEERAEGEGVDVRELEEEEAGASDDSEGATNAYR